jgi:hypothetical protein
MPQTIGEKPFLKYSSKYFAGPKTFDPLQSFEKMTVLYYCGTGVDTPTPTPRYTHVTG